jgi:hypothetical protein
MRRILILLMGWQWEDDGVGVVYAGRVRKCLPPFELHPVPTVSHPEETRSERRGEFTVD